MLGIFGQINIKKVLKNTPTTTRSKSLFGSLICIVIVRLARHVFTGNLLKIKRAKNYPRFSIDKCMTNSERR